MPDNDVTLRKNLESQIRGRLRGQVHEVNIQVHKDGVILRGRAPTYYAKQLAQQFLIQSTRLRILANEIQVAII